MGDHVLVLTAAAGVPEDLAAAVAGRLGVSSNRLGLTAVEMPAGTLRGDDLAALIGDAPVDANLVPVAGRRKTILLADMDSTIIGVECIDELADFAGVKPQVAAITERAMRGELDFEAALTERVALLKGLPVTVLAACYGQRVRLNVGAREAVHEMNAAGATTALVSGGFTYFTSHVAAAAGFAINRANLLLEADGYLTGEVARPILGRAAKLATLHELCKERGVTPFDVIAIGDGANDLDMIRAAGLGVAYRAKPALRAEADAVLDRSDLTALLALQGLPVPIPAS